jgi:hypothetical protein
MREVAEGPRPDPGKNPFASNTTLKKYTTAFINTDAISNGDYSLHDAWIVSQVIVTSGDEFYKNEIDKLAVGATIYVYANRIGVVAAGIVLDECSVTVTDSAQLVSPEPVEYQRKVRWFADIARDPVPYSIVMRLCGVPSRAVRSIVKGKDALREAVITRAGRRSVLPR